VSGEKKITFFLKKIVQAVQLGETHSSWRWN